ncbi:hypothetical protein, partial [Klebsiella pneumoniae]|uniref:hypothetical protein n=1 Tax=Klebsiella pneumoniae TaxID=573 RepID=UPI00254E0D62
MLLKNGDADKQTMYTAYTGKKYTAAADYLLRNELRLLSREIELYIAETEAAKKLEEGSIHAEVWLMQRMLQG